MRLFPDATGLLPTPPADNDAGGRVSFHGLEDDELDLWCCLRQRR